MTCGVCHAGGGQMEYDRNQSDYTATTSTPTGDRWYYKPAYWNGTAKVAGGLVQTTMSAANKAEVDCLLCHMNASKNGVAWLRSLGCGPTNPIGPMNDPTCTGAAPYGPAFPGADVSLAAYAPGTAYDMYNRNMALKNAKFNFAASLGIGAVGTFTSGVLTGVSNMPASIDGTLIASTPNSKNCSVCHARDDSTAGLPGMMQMKYGYGNYGSLVKIGQSLDTDTGAANTVEWFELGCKTGMGKRAHRIGQGPNANWGMSMFNVMFGLGKNGNPVVSESIVGTAMPVTVVTKERMPDADIHEVRRNGTPTGMQCASCHYALGSRSLEGGSRTFPAGTHHGVAYPEETVYGIDHQFAQSDSAPDTKGKNNLDGTVSCEGCHTTRDHPRVTSGQMNPPFPLHAGLPALHLQKIACITCHIPEVYAAPGRLKYRDWSVGDYKAGKDGAGGFRNMLDWNYDLVTGSHKTVPVLRAWITKEGERKINPFLPSVMPIWIKTGIVVNTTTPAVNAGDIPYPLAAQASPVKHRDTQTAAEAAKAAGLLPNVRLNGGNMVPLFDGFSLADSWAIDTKTEIDNMLGVSGFNGGASKLKLFFTPFDVTHGVTPKEWALGGTKRGGCVSCHSSANPKSPYYSPNSMAFFESYQQPLNLAGQGIGQYDLLKNWFALFADYDCTDMVNGLCSSPATCEAMCTMKMGYTAAQCSATSGFCAQAATACVGFPFNDAALFNLATGGTPTNNAFLNACVGQMTAGFDAMMGFPAGTAQMMGMYDGIAGLQGFTVRETLDRSLHGCNPFGGPASSAVSTQFGANVNNCMPAAYSGTCNATTHVCEGGFRNTLGCANSGDCAGTLAASEAGHSPNGLLYSRDEMRKHFRITLQQSTGGAAYSAAASRVTFPMTGFEPNPLHPTTHVVNWDQAQKCVDQMGFDTACTDGGYIKTTVNANDFLGYTAAEVAYLQSFAGTPINPSPTSKPMAQFSYLISGLTVTFDASPSLNATSVSWAFTGTGIIVSSTTTTQAVVTYPAAGTYTATLTATNASGNSTKTMTIVLSSISMSTAPTASFTIAPYTTKTVSITDKSTGAAKVFVNWGDGTAAELASAGSTTDHTYAANGTYKIILAARNSYGASSGAGAEVTVPVMGTISGTVSAGTGSQDAFITVYNGATLVQSVYSNATGSYTTKVPAGTYTVNATKYGFVFNSQTVGVTAGGSATANFTALPSTVLHKISGVVDKAPAGLIVSCHPTGSAVVLGAQFTDGNGAFSFAGLADNATYDIIAQPTGTHVVTPVTLTRPISGADVVISAGTWTYQ